MLIIPISVTCAFFTKLKKSKNTQTAFASLSENTGEKEKKNTGSWEAFCVTNKSYK